MASSTRSFSSQPTIALITADVVGERMSSLGIRYWEIARVLNRQFPVRLIVPPMVSMIPPEELELPASLHLCADVPELRRQLADCDAIITPGMLLFFYPFLSELGKPLVLDIYNPFLLEDLQCEAGANMSHRLTSHENFLAALRLQLAAGDFFICAGEKQRDYWLGTLSTAGRVNPYTYDQDPTLRRLIDVVPFGLPAEPPRPDRPVLKGVYKTIAPDDKVILWGGGIWHWFDAPAMVRAMPLILQQRPEVKLFFMGINPPNENIAKMRAAANAVIALSQELGLYDQSVFFNDWVPYEERQNYLLEADVGISLHLDHVETRFAFRTRLLDYLWAGLPIVTTRGEVMGEALAAQKLACLVGPGDVPGIARAILSLLDQPALRTDYAARFSQVASAYHWDAVARPLVNFCTAPYLAPDKAYLPTQAGSPASPHLLAKGWRALRLGGLSGLLQQTGEYVRWKVSKYQKL